VPPPALLPYSGRGWHCTINLECGKESGELIVNSNSSDYGNANPYGMMQPPPPPKRRHPVRAGCLYTLAGVVVLIIVISAIASYSGGHSSPAPAAAPASSAAHTPGLGTAVFDGKFKFVVTSVSSAKSAGDTADGLGATAQGEYQVLHVTVENIGTVAQTLSDSAQYVYDGAGRKFTADSNADVYLNEAGDAPLLESINPGNTVHGEIAFDIPAGDTAVRAELHDSLLSDGVTVELRS
jgi:hypothetical protein